MNATPEHPVKTMGNNYRNPANLQQVPYSEISPGHFYYIYFRAVGFSEIPSFLTSDRQASGVWAIGKVKTKGDYGITVDFTQVLASAGNGAPQNYVEAGNEGAGVLIKSSEVLALGENVGDTHRTFYAFYVPTATGMAGGRRRRRTGRRQSRKQRRLSRRQRR